jgi:alpha-N-arabinofuranosidase
MDELATYIQDALDLIEFANGPARSPWGARRAAMGHPRPFNMKLLGIGNEQWGPQYIERYARFARVLKEKHPEIQLITAAGPLPDDERFHFIWSKMRRLKADIVDEHCYANPVWFFANAHRYDRYDRDGPKVFMGEYAAQSVAMVSTKNQNTLECALSEAAYLTGLERNADVVRMASYAPLFGHVDAWQWTPNLIWVDNLRIYGTPNYYVQQLFSRNRGDVILPTQLEGVKKSASGVEDLYASATRDNKAGELILKVVNAKPKAISAKINLKGVKRIGPGSETIFAGANLDDVNSFAEPKKVAPKIRAFKTPSPIFKHTFRGNSLTVLRIRA